MIVWFPPVGGSTAAGVSLASSSREIWPLGFVLSVGEMQTRADSPLHPQEALGFQLLPSAKALG